MQVVSKPSGPWPDGYQKQINLDLLRLKEIAGLTPEYLDLNVKLTMAEMDLQESLNNIKKIKDEKSN